MKRTFESRSPALLLLAGAISCTGGLDVGASQNSKGEPIQFSVAPGATALSPALLQRVQSAYLARGEDYQPRTEHLKEDGSPIYINRLILEDSPYLIQHAHNPVDWYAWGEEAFAKAKRESKPIFLSIGYSTCHWCHVMERESFDDVSVARILNENFVAIKVDREQRPDVDEVYMTAVQLMTGRGGWPMSTLLTSDGKPFFGGTYFPRDRFSQLLENASEVWQRQRPELIAQAERLAEAVAKVTNAAGAGGTLEEPTLAAAVKASLARFDKVLGGFSGAPKFPHEPELLFLLDRVLRFGDENALEAVEVSLDHMARGGIYDQAGGGFHRYSTDNHWLVPHFEKMLYNQAHLARAYLQCSRLTGNWTEERVARQTLDYVLRDMTAPDGGFYSATDADSEGREGEFFVWTAAEIRAALPSADAKVALRAFGVTEEGNFEGKSILYLPVSLSELATELQTSLPALLQQIDDIREQLYRTRESRVHPLRDEKIVTAWNAMMITTLAEAGASLKELRYLSAAEKAAEFLWTVNRKGDDTLWRIHLDGNSSVAGNHNDYAYLLEALVTLYDATGTPRWLERAKALADEMIELFWDEQEHGFFMSADDHGGRLLVRPKSPTDGAIPSGNSVAVRSLAMLAARTGIVQYRTKAQATLGAFSAQVKRQPSAFGYLLLGAAQSLGGDSGPLEYGGGGVVRASAAWLEGDSELHKLEVHLDLAAGWHINSSAPRQKALIPTKLELFEIEDHVRLVSVRYPEPEMVTLGFQEDALAVYQKQAKIRADVEFSDARRPPVTRFRLTIQACDESRCLLPEELVLEVLRRGASGSSRLP